MAIALVFFLLCVMVGVVVLSAATVSAGNTARERQLYRETLALTSAAQLLSDDIQSMTFTGVQIETEKVTTTVFPEDENEKTKVERKTITTPGEPKIEGSDLFKVTANGDSYSDSLDLYLCYAAIQGGMPNKQAAKQIEFGAVPDQNIPAVTGSVRVEADYTITVVLECGDNSLTMSFPPRTSVKTEIGEPTTVTGDNTSTVTIQKTHSTIVKWERPLMWEGGTVNA